MKYTLTISDLSADEVTEVMGKLETGKPDRVKPGKPGKVKPAPVEEVDEDNDDMGLGTEEAEESEVTADDVRAAFQAYVKKFGDVKKGRVAAKKVLTKFKAESVDDLDEGDYEKVIATLKK